MNTKQKHHYVFSAGEWIKCTKANPLRSGWLEYELKDGTAGLTKKWAFGVKGSFNTIYPK